MMTHRLLNNTELSPEVQKALSSAPSKMMAARGMAPLSNPRDVLTILYQLILDSDEKIKTSAAKSFAELPPNLCSAAAKDTSTHPLVLDRLVGEKKSNRDLVQIVILNQSAADETIAKLAKTVETDLCDLIAQNEARLLKCADIVAALYLNKKARMSTVDRVVEFAVRSKLEVPGIPAWDEIQKTLLSPEEAESTNVLDANIMDSMFNDATAFSEAKANKKDTPTPSDDVVIEEAAPPSIRDMTIPMKIRLAVLGNSFDRSVLVRDAKKMVAMAAIKSPGVTDSEAAKYSSNQSLCDDVIVYIANRRDWVKQYGTKLSLVNNPKTPLPIAMRFMTHLRSKDIRALSRSKGVPSALAAQAKRLLHAKSGGN